MMMVTAGGITTRAGQMVGPLVTADGITITQDGITITQDGIMEGPLETTTTDGITITQDGIMEVPLVTADGITITQHGIMEVPLVTADGITITQDGDAANNVTINITTPRGSRNQTPLAHFPRRRKCRTRD